MTFERNKENDMPFLAFQALIAEAGIQKSLTQNPMLPFLHTKQCVRGMFASRKAFRLSHSLCYCLDLPPSGVRRAVKHYETPPFYLNSIICFFKKIDIINVIRLLCKDQMCLHSVPLSVVKSWQLHACFMRCLGSWLETFITTSFQETCNCFTLN